MEDNLLFRKFNYSESFTQGKVVILSFNFFLQYTPLQISNRYGLYMLDIFFNEETNLC